MDRQEFIDLANVSKRVPGKTHAQVSNRNPSGGFYHSAVAFNRCSLPIRIDYFYVDL